jgi:exonuclease III
VSADNQEKIAKIDIDIPTRGAEKPSDHVPLIIELAS